MTNTKKGLSAETLYKLFIYVVLITLAVVIIVPVALVSALSVALYGMFVAIIIPAAKTSKVVGGVVLISFAASFAVSKISVFSAMSDSMKISLLTVVIAGAAAFFFPLKDSPKQTGELGEGNPTKC